MTAEVLLKRLVPIVIPVVIRDEFSTWRDVWRSWLSHVEIVHNSPARDYNGKITQVTDCLPIVLDTVLSQIFR